jgi:hypothetical protein
MGNKSVDGEKRKRTNEKEVRDPRSPFLFSRTGRCSCVSTSFCMCIYVPNNHKIE